jgi:hypothetical protein
MVLDITFDVLTPDDRVVIIWPKELGNVFRPCINSSEPLLSEDVGQVSMDSNNGGSGNVVTKDPDRRDSLCSVSEL